MLYHRKPKALRRPSDDFYLPVLIGAAGGVLAFIAMAQIFASNSHFVLSGGF